MGNRRVPAQPFRLLCTCDSVADQDGRGCVRVGCYDFLREFVIGIGHGFSRPITTSFSYRLVSTDNKFSRSLRSNVEVISIRRISLSFHVTYTRLTIQSKHYSRIHMS